MRLVPIDLDRSELPHEHPDVVNGRYYLLVKTPFEGRPIIHMGTASRAWFGIMFHCGGYNVQFDPPGHNSSNLLELYEIRDEPGVSREELQEFGQRLEGMIANRRERRSGRGRKRRKIQSLEHDLAYLEVIRERQARIIETFMVALRRISEQGRNSGGHCGCHQTAMDLAYRALAETGAGTRRFDNEVRGLGEECIGPIFT